MYDTQAPPMIAISILKIYYIFMKSSSKNNSTKKFNIISIITGLIATVFLLAGCGHFYSYIQYSKHTSMWTDAMCTTDTEYYATHDEIDQDYNTCQLAGLNQATINVYGELNVSVICFATAAILYAIVLNKR